MGQDKDTSITDEQRRLAESKKLTLQPVSGRVVTDDLPDEQIATNHLVGPALPNTANDTEQNSTPIQPSASAFDKNPSSPRRTALHYGASSAVVLGIFIVGGAITGAVFFLIQ